MVKSQAAIVGSSRCRHDALCTADTAVTYCSYGGDVVTLFVTGIGQATSAVTIHGDYLPVTPLSVDKGTVPGVMQIKVPIPIGQDCDTPVVVQVGNAGSQSGVSIGIDVCY